MKLISMTDFVEFADNKLCSINSPSVRISNYGKTLDLIVNYKNFLKQPLTLGMFVPCDEEGNVLEEPIYPSKFRTGVYPHSGGVLKKYEIKLEQYQQAKERVLFEGFELNHHPLMKRVIHKNKNLRINDGSTIESVLKRYGNVIELTPTALKQIGL